MTTSAQSLRSFVDRIERLESEVKELNSDKSDIYSEAKSSGFDVKALKAVIAYRRKDPAEAKELGEIFDTYMAALEAGTAIAPRARTRNLANAIPFAPLPDSPPAAPLRLVTADKPPGGAALEIEGIPPFLDRRTL